MQECETENILSDYLITDHLFLMIETAMFHYKIPF